VLILRFIVHLSNEPPRSQESQEKRRKIFDSGYVETAIYRVSIAIYRVSIVIYRVSIAIYRVSVAIH
jgi:hypothetical protein